MFVPRVLDQAFSSSEGNDKTMENPVSDAVFSFAGVKKPQSQKGLRLFGQRVKFVNTGGSDFGRGTPAS